MIAKITTFFLSDKGYVKILSLLIDRAFGKNNETTYITIQTNLALL